ncbi:hypothetical protein ACI3LY_005504 [Candidozyma auris]|nr:hypothetical protein QG37_03777 [[Candida] auris]
MDLHALSVITSCITQLCTCDHLNEIEEFFTLKDQSLYEINRQLQGDNTGKFKIAERNHDDIEHSVSTRKIEVK